MEYNKNSYQGGYEPVPDSSSNPPPPPLVKLENQPLIANSAPDNVFPVYQPSQGEHFTYVCPVTYQKHHIVLLQDRFVIEFEDTRKRAYNCWTGFIDNSTHVGVKLQWRKFRFQGSVWTSLSFLCIMMILTTLILSWIGVSPFPDRNTTIMRTAAGFGIANFLLMFLTACYIIKQRGINSDTPSYRRSTLNQIGGFLYAIGLALMMGVFISSCGFMYRSEQEGLGKNYYFNFITCKETSFDPNNYVYASMCDSGTFGWVQAMIVHSFTATLILILAHFLYFGNCLPFWFEDVTDKINNPCNIKFFGPALAGYPIMITLARKDAEKLIEGFYERFDRKAAPSIGHKIASPNWVAFPGSLWINWIPWW